MAVTSNYRVVNLGSSNTVAWTQSDVFIKNISANTTLTLTDTYQTIVRLIVHNTSGSDRTLTFLTPGRTIRNASDMMLRVRANTTLVYEFTADATSSFLYCLAPLRLEAIFSP